MSEAISANNNWARASAVMAAGTVVSRILGFVKAIILTATIGVTMSGAADAFALANKLPNNIYAIIAGGLLNAILVPQIVRAGFRSDGGERFINRLLTLFITIFGLATVLATLAAPLLVYLYAGTSASLTQDTIALAIAFAYWCLPQIFFYALYTVFGEVLNAKRIFGPFMWTPVVNNLIGIAGLIAFLVLFGPMGPADADVTEWDSGHILLLAGTATLGVAAQALLLLMFWKKAGLSLKLDFQWRGNGFRKVGKLYSWTFGSLLVMQGSGLISTQVAFRASSAGASVAALDTAWLVVMLPHAIAVVSITTTFFTTMSHNAAEKNWNSFRENLATVGKIVSLIAVISSLFLMVVSHPFGMAFTSDYIQAVQFGEVIFSYAIGLVFYSLVYVLQRTFFALEDTKTPFIYNLIYSSFYVFFVLLCVFLPLDKIAIGVGVVTSVGMLLQFIVAARLLKRKIDVIDFSGLIRSLVRFFVFGIVSAGLGVIVLTLLGGLGEESFAMSGRWNALLTCLIVGSVMLLSYLLMLIFTKSQELSEILASLKR